MLDKKNHNFPKVEVLISLLIQEETQTLGTVKDISLIGCNVDTNHFLPEDSKVYIKFITPNELNDVSTRGRVVSINYETSDMKIEFYAMPPEYRTALRTFIKKEIGQVLIKAKREDKRIPVTMSAFSQKGEKLGTIKDISVSGCFIHLNNDYDFLPKTELTLKFTLPGTKTEITVKTIILKFEKRAMGVKFESISNENKFFLKTFINQLAGSHII